ncbi:MAG: RNA 2',3'-cyclic phosphodiesterase [Chloroflexi bacterium]|nr:RNA 2',3'-cyclic phosphodiesterase [Chloroflexota bacterium]
MRTFIAIELSPSVQKQLHQVQIALQMHLRDQQIPELIQWTPVTKIHLTLRFLGETRETEQAFLARHLTAITQAQPEFSLAFGKLGCFPNFRAPNVVWLGVQGDLVALQYLQKQIEQIAREAAFEPENRPFAPHITLGRTHRNSDRAALRGAGAALQSFQAEVASQQRQPLPSEPFVVNQIVHMQSELRPEGARYTPIRHYQFR